MPASNNIILFGKANSGKTKLVDRIKKDVFNSEYIPTIGTELNAVKFSSGTEVLFWEHSGNPRFRILLSTYTRNAKLGIYCVSSEADITDDIKDDIAAMRTSNENLPIIIVVTKSDLNNQAVIDDKIAKINALNIPKTELFGAVSSKNKGNIDKLTANLNEKICNYQQADKFAKASLYEQAKRNLYNEMQINKLSPSKFVAMEFQIQDLESALRHPTADKVQAIDLFTKKAQEILKDSSGAAIIMKAVISLAATVIVVLLFATVGFLIGLAAGSWAGPGAFVSAILASEMAAVKTVVYAGAFGLLGGANVAYGLFSKPSALGKVDKVAEAAKEEFVLQP